MAEKDPSVTSILETEDTFVAAIPWSSHRTVIVHRRQHGGRTYIRLQIWNCHRNKKWWYPTHRFFVIPVENANALADAISAAARAEQINEKPGWLQAFEDRDPAVVKRGSIRRRRKEDIIAERREQVAGVVAGLERAVGAMSAGYS